MPSRRRLRTTLCLLAIVTFAAETACARPGSFQDPLAGSTAADPARVAPEVVAQRLLDLRASSDALESRFEQFADRGGWRSRGYFDAADHDAIEALLFRFVTLHRATWGEIDRLGGVEPAAARANAAPDRAVLGLGAGLALADASAFLVARFQHDPVAIAKLDEAFYRSEIPAGTYSQLRLAVTSGSRQRAIAEAWARYAGEAEGGSSQAEAVALPGSALSELRASLPGLYARWQAQALELDAGQGRALTAIEHGRAAAAARTVTRDADSLGYEARAKLFKAVSRIKNPTAHPLRFTPEQKRELADRLRPGDLILTYTAGYVSDVFIPGAFKHGITYVGDPAARAAAGLTPGRVPALDRPGADRFAAALVQQYTADGQPADLIEAVAEGVKFSNFDRILDTHVNRLVVLRPQLGRDERVAFLAGVFAFLGDPYDFDFDFADATRQVCTEVIYRALDGKGGVAFALSERAGHPTLSADDVVAYHFATPGRFEVVAFAQGDPSGSGRSAGVWSGSEAESRLADLMASTPSVPE